MVVGNAALSPDVLVIGGGPGGYVAAIRAAQLGKDVVLVEKDELGGLCLNYGCIPSKSLINAAEAFTEGKIASAMGITATAKLDVKKMQEWRLKVIKQLRDGISYLCKKHSIEVIKGTAFFQSSRKASISTEHGMADVEFKNCIIATGSKPFTLKGLDFDGINVVSSREALEFNEIPKELIVIGGGYVGIELGTVYAKLGSHVTILEATSRILQGNDDDVVIIVKKRLSDLGVTIRENTKASSTKTTSGKVAVTVESAGKQETLKADKVLIALGHKPVTQELHLEKTRVELDERGFIKVNEKRQTTDPAIYAVGDVAGGLLLAHKASKEAKIAAEAIAGKAVAFDNTVPSVIFCDPEIASVGLNEAQARAQNPNVLVGKFPLKASGRALTLNQTEGFAKVIADENHNLLGIQVVGPNASDLIGEAVLALELHATLDDLAYTIHPHPTLCEALSEAAENALKKGIHV